MDEDLRIVLLGKTGAGKSSTANTILGRDAFRVANSLAAVTKTCEKEEAEESRRISIIDTPGLFDPSVTEETLKAEIEKCMQMSAPGPHVFLLVIRLGDRFTEEDVNVVRWIENHFGNDASRYTMILFTHNDQVTDRTLNEYVVESPHVQKVIEKCNSRYHSFNNLNRESRDQVTALVHKIEEMLTQNGEEHYTYEMYRNAQRGKNGWASWLRTTAEYFIVLAPFIIALKRAEKVTVVIAVGGIEVLRQVGTEALKTTAAAIMETMSAEYKKIKASLFKDTLERRGERQETGAEGQGIVRTPVIATENEFAGRRRNTQVVMVAAAAAVVALAVSDGLGAGAAGMSIVGAAAKVSAIAAALAVAAAAAAAVLRVVEATQR